MDIITEARKRIYSALRIQSFHRHRSMEQGRDEKIGSCTAAMFHIEQIQCENTRIAMTLMLMTTYGQEIVHFARITLSENKGQL
ncbi:hypothetical protein LOKG_00004 [Loktanella phage pCB2051-A]|uniref:Uncharacterized protein n=1 Tax=Loktanella phage pCB2051-A TaxID=754044 RepID=M4QNW6_9CAUD|nr:hypothetical protein LOKG_00004 [Loktanella phage pCB2051-A]AGH31441.1 hypothetical protein LOKG_00004 [Loktanella phage pCB2051-A]